MGDTGHTTSRGKQHYVSIGGHVFVCGGDNVGDDDDEDENNDNHDNEQR